MTNIIRKVNVLGQISKHLSKWTKLTVTIIAPQFCFYSSLFFLMNATQSNTCQKNQNKALCLILGYNKSTIRTYMLNSKNLLSVRQHMIP